MMKKIAKAQVLTLKEQVSYQEGQVVSKTLAQNSALSVTLFSFDKGEEISAHKSGGALAACLDGAGRVTIDGKPYELHPGESIVMRPPDIRMQYTGRNGSKCCWRLSSEKNERPWAHSLQIKQNKTAFPSAQWESCFLLCQV